MKTKTTLSVLFILFYFFSVSELSATCLCTSIADGEWSETTTWSCVDIGGGCTTGIPGSGDVIIIAGQHIVTIESTVDLSTPGDDTPTFITIHGTLSLEPPSNSCGGGACDIDLILDTDSEIDVTSDSDPPDEKGIRLGGPGGGQRTVTIGTVDVLLNPSDFPFGPGMLPQAPLPVELASFSGFTMERTNILKWQTASEENTFAFLLERSLDGRDDFEEIGRVDAFGNSTSVRNYEIEDENPVSLSYYRLRIVDFDGSFEFSDVIAVERSKTEIDLVEVYPVPAEEDVTVLVHARVEGKAILTLSDFMGRKINEETITLKAGINHYTFDFGDHETNFYYLTIYNGKEKIARKILRATKD